jgi:hypothetical protein
MERNIDEKPAKERQREEGHTFRIVRARVSRKRKCKQSRCRAILRRGVFYVAVLRRITVKGFRERARVR